MQSMSNLPFHFGIQLRIYPSQRQKRIIKVNSDDARYAYNHLIGLQQKSWYLRHTPAWNPFIYPKMLKRMKPMYKMKWLKDHTKFMKDDKYVDSLALANETKNNHRAWSNYQHGLQYHPTFHAKKKHPYEWKYQTSCSYRNSKHGKVGSVCFLDKHHIKLPKLKQIRISHVRNLVWDKRDSMRIGTVTLYKNPQNHFYVSLQLASSTPFVHHLANHDRELGYDLNTSNYVTMSNGTVVSNPRYYRKAKHKLQRIDKIVSRRRRHNHGRNLRDCYNYQQIRLRRAIIARHVMNQRKNFLNQLSKKLIENQDWIFGEDLKSKNMLRNHRIAQSIQDTGWRMFITMLQQKAQMYGKHVCLVDPAYTTQICHSCGYNMDKNGHKIKLGVEHWTCPRCHVHHSRDLNAAKNILTRGQRKKKALERKSSHSRFVQQPTK